jgi:hypothetical protein
MAENGHLQLFSSWLSRNGTRPRALSGEPGAAGAFSFLEGVLMNYAIKGAMIASVAALALSLSACGGNGADANASATPDPAEQTAASIDQATPMAPAGTPTDVATGASSAASDAAK